MIPCPIVAKRCTLGSWDAASSARGFALFSALLLCGCTQVLDVNEYHVQPSSTPGPTCKALQAVGSTGSCEDVGVDVCADGFSPDTRGGCTPVLPSSDCPVTGPPTAVWPAKPTCSPITLCGDPNGWPQSRRIYQPSMYVKQGAAGGDGTKEHPFGTVSAAIDAGAGEILIGSGRIVENLVLSRPISINGNCPEQTAIVAADPTKPVLTFVKGADRSYLDGLELTGGSDGIVAQNTALDVFGLWVHDVTQSGITIDDPPPNGKPTALAGMLVERAGERGIVVRGGQVNIGTAMIRDIGGQNVSPAIGAIGIEVQASRWAPWVFPPSTADGGVGASTNLTTAWSPSLSTPGSLSISKVYIEGVDQGLLVEGSKLDADGVAVRDTSRGVVARFRSDGGIPASVTLSQSTIERSRLVGVDIWNATATIDRTTIRPAETTCPAGPKHLAGSYLGNGIRARYDRNVTADTPRPERSTTVKRSLIDGAAQSGVHMEGGSLVLDHTAIRDTATEACTNEFGDGIAIYNYDFSPADLTLVATRISGSQRAAVASFGTPLDLDGGSLDCNASDVVYSGEAPKVSHAPSCGCNGSGRACNIDAKTLLARAVVAANCDSGQATDCVTVCMENIFVPGTVVSNGTFEILDGARIAPAITDQTGCASVGGVEAGEPLQGLFFADGYTTGVASLMVDSGAAAPASTYTPALSDGEQGDTEKVTGFWPGAPADVVPRLDFGGGLGVGFFICGRPTIPLPPGGPLTFRKACGPDPNDSNNATGVPGMTIDVLRKPGPSTWYGPTYSSAGAIPDPTATSAIGGFSFYLNTPPGDYEAVLHPPPGKSLSCTPDLLGGSGKGAWNGSTDGSGNLHFPFRVQPAAITGAVFLYCDVSP